MTPERWRKIEELCHAALERDRTLRGAFLEEACAGDEELQREVESLLAEEDGVQSFLKTPALELARKMSEDPEFLRQIEELYHAAREDRAALEKADPELRHDVESLLAQKWPIRANGAVPLGGPGQRFARFGCDAVGRGSAIGSLQN